MTINPKKDKTSYAYDANGNRTNDSFTVGPNNRLAYDGTFTYTYDNEGNRLVKMMLPDIVVTSYSWDQRNRLANAGAVNFRYDYLNRLVPRAGDIFVHDGYQIVLQFTNGVLSHRYFWGANQDELVADEPATSSSTPSTQTLWALCDHLGSVRDLLRLNGTTPVVANHLTYNAFGSRVGYTSLAAADMTLFRYTGKMTDDTTRLQWNINRWYDAYAGKWISEDPIGFRGNDVNLYRYVGNLVAQQCDLSGLSWYRWTDASALAQLVTLRAEWLRLGYSFAVALLDEYIAQTGKTDFSAFSAVIESDSRYQKELASYLKPKVKAALKHPYLPTCIGTIRDISPTKSVFRINYTHYRSYASGDDLAYALGNSRFSHEQLLIEVLGLSGKKRYHVLVTGEFSQTDGYYFDSDTAGLGNYDYDAAYYLYYDSKTRPRLVDVFTHTEKWQIHKSFVIEF